MDPLARVLPDADTSFALMLEAQARGHAVFHVPPSSVGYADGDCVVTAAPATVTRGEGCPGFLGPAQREPASRFDVVWVRTDPPFDADYLHATQLLELAEARGTLVVNKPSGLRAANEHLYMLRFPDLGPASFVSADAADLLRFMEQCGTMVLKPIDGHGGEGVVVLSADDLNRRAIIDLLTAGGRTPVLAQDYLPAARAGDKRVLVLDGELLGAVNRVPRDDEHRGNLHVGARAERSTLTAREVSALEALAPALRADGLWFVGLDFIGGVITEVNVTSPTGIQEIERLDGTDLCGPVWDWCEAHARPAAP